MDAADPEKPVLVLSAPELGIMIAFLALASAICLLLALAYMVPSPDPADRFRSLCFAGFGLFCFSAIFLVSSFHPWPRRLIFDNAKGWLTVLDRNASILGELPYSSVSGFSVCGAMSDRIARHTVGMEFSRGGRWELFSSPAAGRATAWRDAIAARVKLDAPVREQPPSAHQWAPERLTGHRVRYAWKRTTGRARLAIALAVVLSFDAALVGSKPFASSTAAYAVALGAAAALLLGAAAGIFRTLGQRWSVEIGQKEIGVERSSALSRPRAFSVSFLQLAAVDLSMTFSRPGTQIVLLRPEEVDRFVRFRQGTLSPGEMPGIISLLRGLLRIDVSALPVGARIHLAEAMREALSEALSRARSADPSDQDSRSEGPMV